VEFTYRTWVVVPDPHKFSRLFSLLASHFFALIFAVTTQTIPLFEHQDMSTYMLTLITALVCSYYLGYTLRFKRIPKFIGNQLQSIYRKGELGE
jgi:hypothetical protein